MISLANKDEYDAAARRVASGQATDRDRELVNRMASNAGSDGNAARAAQEQAKKAAEEAEERRQSAW